MQRLDAGGSFCAMEEQNWMLIKQVQGDGKLNNIFTVTLMSIVKRKNKKQEHKKQERTQIPVIATCNV